LEKRFDILHAHLPWAGILARTVGKSLNLPIVYTEHNIWERYNLLSYWGNRLSFKKQDVAIAVSNEVALSMRLNSIWSPYSRGGRLKVTVVENGVNTEVFRREESTKYEVQSTKFPDGSEGHSIEDSGQRSVGSGQFAVGSRQEVEDKRAGVDNYGELISLKSKLGIPDDAPVIGKVAVFRSQKRLWLWVDLALRILEKRPEAHFLLVGDGDWRAHILKQIEDSGKQKNFHWVGVQKNVIPFLSIMDIYLSTSEFEGLPIAMLEAMSCEVPVVATRAGGIGEVIQQGVQGYLCEIDEWEELEAHCLKLLEEPTLHRQMSAAARERVLKRFSMRRMVKELEAIYMATLAKGA
jgi:glycosyltransferase involved in cell wall biosynthesis